MGSQFLSLSKQTCRLFSFTRAVFWAASAGRILIMGCSRLGMALRVARITGRSRIRGEQHLEKKATFAYFAANLVRVSAACCLVLHRIQSSRPQKRSLCNLIYNVFCGFTTS